MLRKIAVIYLLLFIFCELNANEVKDKKDNYFSFSVFQKDTSFQEKLFFLKQKLNQKEYKRTLEGGLNLLEKARKKKQQKMIILITFLLGETFEKVENYREAKKFYVSSFKELSNLDSFQKDKIGLGGEEHLASRLLKIGGQYHKLELIDSAKIYYERILKLKTFKKSVETIKAKTLSNLSLIFGEEGAYKKAEEYSLKSIEIHKKYNNLISLASANINLGNLYLYKEDYAKAKETYIEGLGYVKYDKGERGVKFKEDLYINLAYVLYLLKDYKSYEYFILSYDIRDSITKKDNEKKLANILAKYNVDTAKREVKQEEELKRQKTQRNIWILGTTSLFIIVLLIFFLKQYQLRQKNLQLELAQKETESQIKVLNASLNGQEAERKRISQELHDGVLSRLFGSRMGLGYLELDSDSETQSLYQKYLEELQSIEKEIREVSHQLSRDISLSETSFLNAINQLLKEKGELGNFNFQLKMDDRFSWNELDGVLEMNLFRILQEALQNVIKHANAENIEVSFKVDKKDLLLTMKDDGVGFDAKKKTKGIGLKNIKSRVEQLKGELNVLSENNKGTSIKIKIPIV